MEYQNTGLVPETRLDTQLVPETGRYPSNEARLLST